MVMDFCELFVQIWLDMDLSLIAHERKQNSKAILNQPVAHSMMRFSVSGEYFQTHVYYVHFIFSPEREQLSKT